MEFTFQFKGYVLKLVPAEDKLKAALAENARLEKDLQELNLDYGAQVNCIDDQDKHINDLIVDNDELREKLKAANANLTDLRNQLGRANDLLAGYRKAEVEQSNQDCGTLLIQDLRSNILD